MALLKLLLVGLVATAAFWTATEAYEEGQSTRSWVPRYVEGETPKCRPPFSGRWLVTHPGAGGAPAYHVDMFAVNKGIYNGSGEATPPIWPSPPPVPLTLVAQFNKTTCVFAGTIMMQRTNTVVSFVWSVIDQAKMMGTALLATDGILDPTFPLNQTAFFLND